MVTTSGIATTENTTYPARYAIQDGEGAWNGIFVRDIGYPVARGDSLTLTGLVVDVGAGTELDLMIDIETNSTGNPLPEPSVLDPIMVDGDAAYEAVLVTVENVEVTDDDPGDWEVTSVGACRVGRWSGYSYMPLMGDELNVTGVVGVLAEQRKLQPRDDDDIEYVSGIEDGELPTAVSLSQNLPNPFGEETGIAYTLPAKSDVLLQVFNVAGKLVRTLVDGPQPAGRWNVGWDGADENGQAVSNGVYFYRLTTGEKTIEKRMVLVE
jgi:hypothetical protein